MSELVRVLVEQGVARTTAYRRAAWTADLDALSIWAAWTKARREDATTPRLVDVFHEPRRVWQNTRTGELRVCSHEPKGTYIEIEDGHTYVSRKGTRVDNPVSIVALGVDPILRASLGTALLADLLALLPLSGIYATHQWVAKREHLAEGIDPLDDPQTWETIRLVVENDQAIRLARKALRETVVRAPKLRDEVPAIVRRLKTGQLTVDAV